MADFTKIAWKQIRTGDVLDVISGHALNSTNQRLLTTSGVLSGLTNSASGTLSTKIDNLSGWAGVNFSSIQISGGTFLTGTVSLTGVSGLKVVQSGNIALISTDRITTGILVSGSNGIIGAATFVGASGLNAVLTTPTTVSYVLNGSSLTGLWITGSQTIGGLVNYTGYGGLVVIHSGQTIIFSGGAGGGVGNFSGLGIQGAPILTSGGAILSGLSGIVLSSGNPVNNVFGINISQISVTGINVVNDTPTTGWVQFSGVSGASVTKIGNTFYFSGLQGGTGSPGAVGATGPTSDAFFGINFFSDFVYTGLNLAESFVPRNIAYTGYSVGCINTGVGPLVFGLNTPLTGLIYMRGTGGEKTTLTQFTFQSGEKYQTSGNANVTVSGGFRLGYDITNSLSGLGGLTLFIAGSGL